MTKFIVRQWPIWEHARNSVTPECFGRGSHGQFSFEARKCLFSFQRYLSFEEFLVFRAFVQFGANYKRSSSGAFGFDDILELFFQSSAASPSFFANSDNGDRYISENPLSFQLKSRWYLPETDGDPGLSKARRYGKGKSKTKMVTARLSSQGPSTIDTIGSIHLRWFTGQ